MTMHHVRHDPLDPTAFRVLAGGIVILACGLRLYRLGALELWLDEAASWHWATRPDWFARALSNNTPPLYIWWLRCWMALAGESQIALRLPSAVCGTLFVAVVLWLGRSMFTPAVGLWAGLWAALMPLHIYYSQEARAYALLMLVLITTYAALWRALQHGTWRAWMLVCASTTAALYTHYLAILGLLPGIVLVRGAEHPPWRAYTVAMFASMFLFLPWLAGSFWMAPHSLQGTEWIRDAWQQTPPLLAIPRSLEVFGLGSQAHLLPITVKQFDQPFPASLRWLGIATLLVLALCAAILGDDRRTSSRRVPGQSVLWSWLLLPLVALWLISLWKPVYLVGRYDLVALPAYPLIGGLALAKLQRTAHWWSAALIAGVLMIPVAVKLVGYYQIPPQPDLHPTAVATADAIAADANNGDVVVFTDLRALPVLYQLRQRGYAWEDGYCRNDALHRLFACRMFPLDTEATPAAYDARRVLNDPDAGRADAEIIFAMLHAPADVVHVVFGNYAVTRGRLAVATVESLLVGELQRRGFRPIATDLRLGTIAYRRADAASLHE